MAKELLYIEAAATIEANAGEEGTPKVFRMEAYKGGPMQVGFELPTVVDLAGMTISEKPRPILRDHSPTRIVGHTTKITNDGQQLGVQGVISGGGGDAQEVLASARAGFPWQASIGAEVARLENVPRGKTATVNKRSFRGPLLIARQTVLREISFTALGADDNTSATVAASRNNETMADKINAQDEPENLVTEELRIEQIEAAVEEFPSEKAATICATAIGDGWSLEKAKLHMLRANREAAPAPAVHTRKADAGNTINAIQGGLMLRAGLQLDSPIYQTTQAHALKVPAWLRANLNSEAKQRALEAAHKFEHVAMFDMCIQAIRLDGGMVPEFTTGRAGKYETIQAAFSGSSLTNVFTNSMNAVLLSSYMESGDTTGGWTQEEDVENFKLNERTRLKMGSSLAPLPRGKSAKHDDRSDITETYKIARYAKQMVIDEQDIIDDSLKAFGKLGPEMGRAAGRLRPDLVYSILLANAALADGVALFHTDHNNDASSAPLASIGLKAAIAALEKQQDNDQSLNLTATHLIVPSDLKHSAAELLNSILQGQTGSTDATFGMTNTLRTIENIQLRSEARLANGVTDPQSETTYAGSATKWYLASNRAPTIEVGYLKGTGRAPTVRSYPLSNGQWGLGFNVKLDIGAKELDFRGLIRNDQ